MDWQVILTSVITSLLSSSIITAGIIYVLKKSFDRALDYRFEKAIEENRLHAQENARREAAIYDKQFDALKEVLSLTYRLRNSTRDLIQQSDVDKQDIDEKEFHSAMKKFRSYQDALIELMFEERAILPQLLFELIHELRATTQPLYATIEHINRSKKTKSVDELRELYGRATNIYQRIDNLYQLMVNTVQAQIGVVKGKDNADIFREQKAG